MAEVQSRSSAPRGRGSGRAGRGGFSSRGGRQSSSQIPTNGDMPTAVPMVSLDEQGEIGQLKKQYADKVDTLRNLFPDWTDDDLALALQETGGDVDRAAERIAEGNVSQFSDVKKKSKEKTKAKKDAPVTSETTSSSTRGRSRGGHDSSRGTRGRGSDRAGRGGRGGRGGSAAAPRTASTQASVPTTETNGWGETAPTTTTETIGTGESKPADASNDWESSTAAPAADESWATTMSNAASAIKSSIIPSDSKKSWASMLSQPKAEPPKSTTPSAPVSHAVADNDASYEAPAETESFAEENPAQSEALESTVTPDGIPALDNTNTTAETPPATSMGATESGADLTPPRDQLTEDNLENLPDVSHPPATDTVASTRDPSSTVGGPTANGLGGTPTRPPMGGYATTAWRQTGTPGRSASFQRRMMEQREAVVMPGNHAVDRAAVQFGSMGLDSDNKPLDVDDDREEAQTRAPVAQSPPSQPRTSLPQVQQQQPLVGVAPLQETLPTPKQAPGLPMPGSSSAIGGPSATHQIPSSQQGQANQSYAQYGRYGAGPVGQEPSQASSKPYDAFSQQLNYPQHQVDSQSGYPGQSQAASAPQGQSNTSAYNEYNSQFAGDQQRNTSGSYYGGTYGQQSTASQNEQHSGPQRTGSAFANNDSGYNANQTATAHSRFGENQTSGHTTPNPTMASQQGTQPQHVHHAQTQPQAHSGHGGGYQQYQNPYYGGSYGYGQYMNQGYPSNYYNQQGYGQPYGGKGGMYGQPQHGYGLSPQTSYEHSASPANTSGYGSNLRAGSDLASSGLGEYGRSSSTQPSQPPSSGAGGYPGHAADAYGRGSSGYGQSQYGQQPVEESLKPYGESKSGPSPSLGQPGRTGSAVNSGYGSGGNQSSFPPPGTQQPGYSSGYPSQMHNNHSSGYGGVGSHQNSGQSHQHQTAGYGQGYGGAYGQNNYNSYGRGGWGGNYGH